MKKWFNRWTITSLFLACMIVVICILIKSLLDHTLLATIISGAIAASGVTVTVIQWLNPQFHLTKMPTRDRLFFIGSIFIAVLIGSALFIRPLPPPSSPPPSSNDLLKDVMNASPDIIDPLIDGNNQTQLDKWDESVKGANTADGICALDNDGYHVLSTKSRECIMKSRPNIRNFALEVTILIRKGDRVNITFRQSLSGDAGHYTFFVRSDGISGLYAATADPPGVPLIPNITTPSMKQGTYAQNRIGLRAVGGKIEPYVNGQRLASVENSSYQQGFIGLGVTNEKSNVSWAIFSQLKMWIYD
jgi:hypothetical protein